MKFFGIDEWFMYLILAATVIPIVVVIFVFDFISQDYEKKIDFLSDEIDKLTKDKDNLIKKVQSFEKCEENKKISILNEFQLKEHIKDFIENNEKSKSLLDYVIDEFEAMAAIFYIFSEKENQFIVKETFGLQENYIPASFSINESLNGQSAIEGKPRIIEDIPENYFNVFSGLGQSMPKYLYLMPIMDNKKCVALIELAAFKKHDIVKIWKNIEIENEKI